MNPLQDQISSIISDALPEFSPVGELQPLPGGNLNHVWRLEGKPRNIIVKHAPPYIANNPDVPLSPERIHFEAKALALFEKGGPLNAISSDQVRPPYPLHFDNKLHLLVMEDLGIHPNVTEWLVNTDGNEIGFKLGQFIGQLHNCTFQQKVFRDQFNNSNIQQTRLEVQYKPATEHAKRAGTLNTDVIRSKTIALGQKLLSPGCCLVMGDLWPPSILVTGNNIRLIDWEFVHYGRPLQDVAHFAAHCWMQAHTSSRKKRRQKFEDLWTHFWEGYQQALGEKFSELFNEEEFEDAATHIGAEILIRATGPFKEGYVYEGFDLDDEMIIQAGRKAQELILAGDFSSLWKI
ncbi:MAG TPA: phosphotransferase [Balneolaceae bacterium]|nr:phosphotransferase [Balneolaceae bacterium]